VYFTVVLAAYSAEGWLLLAPAALGGARSIRYTAHIELASVVPRALARCRYSKLHHRPVHVARAASAVAPMPFLNRILCRNLQFCTVFRIFHIGGRNFPDVLIRSYLPMTPMNHEKFHGNRSARFSKIQKTDTDRQTWQLYIKEV